MKGEQTMKKVNLNEYAAICRAARRGNLIAKMRVKNVEVDNDNELVKLVAESLKKSSDFFATQGYKRRSRVFRSKCKARDDLGFTEFQHLMCLLKK